MGGDVDSLRLKALNHMRVRGARFNGVTALVLRLAQP